MSLYIMVLSNSRLREDLHLAVAASVEMKDQIVGQVFRTRHQLASWQRTVNSPTSTQLVA